jgi:heme/copper-type cytochrome/quinol oxidase subunit 2
MLRIGAGVLAALAAILLVVYTMVIVAVVLFVIAALVIAVYMLAAKKPEVERHGDWTLDRVKGDDD